MVDTMTPHKNATRGHVRGSVLLVSGRVLAIFINFSVQILTVRYLTKSDYGLFAFALSVAGVLSILSAFGMDKAASRFLSVQLQDQDYSRFWGMVSLMFATVVGLGVIGTGIFLFGWLLGIPVLTSDPGAQCVLAVIAGLAVCNALDTVFIALFAVLASPSTIFVRRYLLGPLLKLASAIIVVLLGGDVFTFAIGQLVAGVLGVGVCVSLSFGILRRHPKLLAATSRPFTFPFRQLYGYSATLLSGDFAFLLRGALVPLVLGLLFQGEEIASFTAVLPFARLNEFVLLTFSVLFLPNAAKLSASEQHVELQALFENTTLWITVLTFPVFAGSFLLAHALPVWLFGADYQSSGIILAWLALGYYANASFGTGLRLLRATRKLGTLLLADLLLVGIAAGTVFFLVPRYGALGGAWAVCATYVAQALLYLVLVASTTTVNPFMIRCVAPFVFGVGLCATTESVRILLAAGWAFSLVAAGLHSIVVLLVFGRDLDVLGAFPEIAKLPLLRRWLPTTSKTANAP
ncbi:MAG: oligosaccharide flippase family protein [Gemmataceae bacterium]